MTKVKSPLKASVAVSGRSSQSFESALETLTSRRSQSDRSRTFPHILASPVHYEANYAYPLIVWLHGAGKTETEVLDVMPKLSARNYVGVAPRGVAGMCRRVVRRSIRGEIVDCKSWNEPFCDWPETEDGVSESENLVFDSIEQAVRKFNINSRRIFLMGRGVGGTMAIRLGLRNPREFAGVVAIDSALPSLDNVPLRNWRAARDLPILLTAGTASPQLTSKQLRLFHAAGLTVVIRQYAEKPNNYQATATRMRRILLDVNSWTMERALNPETPIAEFFTDKSWRADQDGSRDRDNSAETR